MMDRLGPLTPVRDGSFAALSADQRSALQRIGSIFQFTVYPEDGNRSITSCFYAVYDACSQHLWQKLQPIKEEIKAIRNEWQQTVLVHAVVRWENELAADLVRQRIALHERDDQGNTALHHAARKGNAFLLSALAQHLDLDARNNQGHTPLLVAVLTGQERVVRVLLEKGANPNLLFYIHPESTPRLNILEFTVMLDQRSCFTELMSSSHLRQRSPIGNLLHLAVHFGKPEMLNYLLKEHRYYVSSLIEERDEEGRTPPGHFH